jgi:hypothetical protein
MTTLALWLFAVMAALPSSIRLTDLDAHAVDPFAVPAGTKAIAFVFTTSECPISNSYAPVVATLHRQFTPKGVQFWLIYPNQSDTVETIRQHVKAYNYPLRVLRDLEHSLATLAHTTITPEAAVFDREGREVYHGRIDDRYTTVGVQRPAPTKHDLEDALSATLAGKPVAQPVTQAVGCFIE